MARITFLLNGAEACVTAGAGETLLMAARRAGVALDAPCGGHGGCGKCRVKLISGELDAPPSRHLSPDEYAAGWRLACESRVAGDATIEIPAAASAWRGGLRVPESRDAERFEATRRGLEAAGIAFDSGVSAIHITLDPPTLDDPAPDADRLSRALEAAAGVARVEYCVEALRGLARTLREHAFAARCVCERDGDALRVLDVLPPDDPAPVAGLAVDLGTTTVAAALVDLETGGVLARAAAGNAQIRYGADVINRIIESTQPGGGERLRDAVIEETLKPLIQTLCASAGISPQSIYRACVAGNTTMGHLLLGLYAEPVRMEPYVPTFFQMNDLRAASLGLALHPEARVKLAPNIGSYVGGDITAGVFASMLWDFDEPALFVDLGTNGELVFGSREFLLACACSAGPAFEGGDISCGMRAADGAIDRLTIDPVTLEPAFSVIGGGKPAGLCGSGIIDAVAALFRAKLIDGRGRFVRECPRVRRDADGMASYIIAYKETSDGGRDIALTEADVDSFIRAKGAVFSAIMTMLDAAGVTPDALKQVIVAGGIGSGIDMNNAVAVGMLPDIDRRRFRYVGNAALCGALMMLTSRACRDRVDALAAGMTYMELSNEPGYMEAFVAACFLPHTDGRLFGHNSLGR